MHTFRTISRVLAAAVSASCIAYSAPSFAYTITINGTAVSSCSAPVIDGSGNITIDCSTGSASCSVSASPTSVPAAGGTVTLTANCGTVNSWTGGKSASGGNSTSWQDSIPANASSSSVQYVYTVNGANGSNSVTVTQAGTGAAPPPPAGTISCTNIPGITSTTVVNVPWNHLSGLTSTRSFGGFPAGKAFVFQFTTPAGYSSTNTGRFSMVPTDGNAYNTRYMAISATPCDLSGSLAKGAVVIGSGPTIYFTVGAYALKTYFGQLVSDTSVPKLNAGQTYYVTIVQEASPGGDNTCTASTCDINYSLYNPSGT